jgi:hypothetical protein
MRHSSSFTGVIILVHDCKDVVAGWLPKVGVEVCFSDVGFGGVYALQGGAGVEDETVGAVANDVAW